MLVYQRVSPARMIPEGLEELLGQKKRPRQWLMVGSTGSIGVLEDIDLGKL